MWNHNSYQNYCDITDEFLNSCHKSIPKTGFKMLPDMKNHVSTNAPIIVHVRDDEIRPVSKTGKSKGISKSINMNSSLDYMF